MTGKNENLEDKTGASDAQAVLEEQLGMMFYKLSALECMVECFIENGAKPEFRAWEEALQGIINLREDLQVLAFTGGVRPSKWQGILQAVKEAYPGQKVEQSWATIKRMHKAISSGSNGNVADYIAARESDPQGNLALIIGMAYAPYPDKNKQILWNLMNCESSYLASIMKVEPAYVAGILEGLRLAGNENERNEK